MYHWTKVGSQFEAYRAGGMRHWFGVRTVEARPKSDAWVFLLLILQVISVNEVFRATLIVLI
jgi:hypothetical protein